VRDADSVVGTSAGSIVGACLRSGVEFAELFEQQVNPQLQVRELKPPVDLEQLRRDLAAARADGGDTSAILQRIGALALATTTISEAERRAVIADRLPIHDWPDRDLRVVAVDSQSGERTVFDAASRIEFVDAVAASCAVPATWPPVTIRGRRYIDGGAYSTDNADLAAGQEHVLILALRARSPRLAVIPLEAAVQTLHASGSDVRVLHPDEGTEAVFASVGSNLLDPSIRAVAACAGREQGQRIASSNSLTPWRDRRKLRGTIQIVFQDPYSSLNPMGTVGGDVERDDRHPSTGCEERLRAPRRPGWRRRSSRTSSTRRSSATGTRRRGR
jgi:NTE family protein